MNKVTIRVPATTANLGPGFDAFGCALSLYTDVTFEETDFGLEITGCPEEFTGPDNLAYVSYCAVLASLSEEVRGVKIHIDAHIPISISAPSKAGPAAVAQQKYLSPFPRTISPLVPISRKSVIFSGFTAAITPAVISPPTYPLTAGKINSSSQKSVFPKHFPNNSSGINGALPIFAGDPPMRK